MKDSILKNSGISPEQSFIDKKLNDAYVANMLDNNILEYVDGWEDEGYDNEFDYYSEIGRGEAEEDTVNELVSDAKSQIGNFFNKKLFIKLLLDKFPMLKH